MFIFIKAGFALEGYENLRILSLKLRLLNKFISFFMPEVKTKYEGYSESKYRFTVKKSSKVS